MNKKEKALKKQEEIEKRTLNKVNSILFPSHLDSSYQDNPYLALKNINKIYDNNVQAVFDFNLFVNKEEFIVFVGPSGCGKSTTLRMICGLEEITSGGLFIDGVFSNELAPKDRDIAMVFQSYALYPHMSVYDNLAFSLRIRKIPVPVFDKEGKHVLEVNKSLIKKINRRIKELNEVIKEASSDILELEKSRNEISNTSYNELLNYYNERIELANNEIKKQLVKLDEAKSNKSIKYKYKHFTKDVIDQKVREVAKILEIEPFLTRKPKALSGGQRQRVALGRAIVRDAKVFLMDEPLSNLDAKLRVQMRAELVSLHKRLKATTVYVTHDQTEAMTMADRIVVMKDGVIQQTGSPKEIYNHPRNLFVATFIGAPAMNIIPAKYYRGHITFANGYGLDIKNECTVEDFYKAEHFRFKKLIEDLNVALQEPNSKNILVYQRALDKAKSLMEEYDNKTDNEFDIYYGVRPEHIYISDNKEGMEVKVDLIELLGSEYYVHTRIGNTKVVLKTSSDKEINVGDTIYIKFDEDKAHAFDLTSEVALY